MKKGKVFFHPVEGSGALTISWTSRPKGDAIEAQKGDGIGFFSDSGDLLCVIFDEVLSSKDNQSLKFDQYCVDINVKDGKVTYSVTGHHSKSLPRKKRARRRLRTER